MNDICKLYFISKFLIYVWTRGKFKGKIRVEWGGGFFSHFSTLWRRSPESWRIRVGETATPNKHPYYYGISPCTSISRRNVLTQVYLGFEDTRGSLKILYRMSGNCSKTDCSWTIIRSFNRENNKWKRWPIVPNKMENNFRDKLQWVKLEKVFSYDYKNVILLL